MAAATEITIDFKEEDKLEFRWKADGLVGTQAREQAMLMAYCVQEKVAVYETHGAFRETGKDQLSLPTNFKGKSILVYLAFVAPDRQSQSKSVFVGELLVPAG